MSYTNTKLSPGEIVGIGYSPRSKTGTPVEISILRDLSSLWIPITDDLILAEIPDSPHRKKILDNLGKIKSEVSRVLDILEKKSHETL